MKKLISILLSAILLSTVICAAPFTVSAAVDEPETLGASSGTTGDCTWTLDDNGTLTISGNGAMGDYYYKYQNGYYFTTAPWGTNIKSVVIENGVTNIGEYAFIGCTGLTSVTIGNSVTSIGGLAFSRCKSLTSVTIPDSVTSIGYRAFFGCTDLTSVTIGNSVTSIGLEAFSGCESLTSVTIPDSVTSIGTYAFNNTAWYNNQPDGLIYAGKVVYTYKGALPSNTSIVIKEGTKGIADSAFSHCTCLKSITIPDSVTSIGSSAFDECKSLTSVTIPDSVTSIGSGAFYGCKSLTSVTIPDSVTSIDNYAFFDCTGLTSITVDSSNKIYDSRNNCNAIIKTAENELLFGCNFTVIPDSVISIGEHAFSDCTGLTSVTIPDSVTNIGWYAFSGCIGLTSVTIPDSVTSIGSYAFYNTKWYNNQPDGLIYAGKFVYKYKGTMPSNTSIVIKEGTKGIAGSAFYERKSLTSVTIPDSVTSIGGYAFLDCTGLTGVTIPDSVTGIGDSAFYGCESLTSITIPDSVTSIGDDAFSGCTGLTSVTVDSGNNIYDSRNNCNAIIKTAENELLFGCKSTVIPNSVTSIGGYAFRGCTGLTSIDIPDSVTSIDSYAFYDCKNLTSITIPDSVTSIGVYAFEECTGLKSVTIPDSVTSIGYNAFGYMYINFRDEKVDGFTIYGKKGSAAEQYANDNGFIFKETGSESSKPIGDANGDGNVDVLDAATIQKFASGMADMTSDQQYFADVNNDGVVDILDAADVQKFAAGIITEFKKKG